MIQLRSETLSGIAMLLTIVALLFSRKSPWIFFGLLILTIILDFAAWKIRNPRDRAARLADWTSDRLCEGMIFSVFWFPWLLLFVLNCALTLFSFLKRETYILPLRHLFLGVFLARDLLKLF